MHYLPKFGLGMGRSGSAGSFSSVCWARVLVSPYPSRPKWTTVVHLRGDSHHLQPRLPKGFGERWTRILPQSSASKFNYVYASSKCCPGRPARPLYIVALLGRPTQVRTWFFMWGLSSGSAAGNRRSNRGTIWQCPLNDRFGAFVGRHLRNTTGDAVGTLEMYSAAIYVGCAVVLGKYFGTWALLLYMY
jgi:hypothetical protein